MSAKDFLNTMIQLGSIIFLVVMSFKIFEPFAMIMLWALVLSIMIYPVHQYIVKRMGGKQGRAATVIVLVGILLMGGPATLLGFSLTAQVQEMTGAYESGEMSLKMPDPSVESWPLIGERVYEAWSEAASDLPHFVESHAESILSVANLFVSLAGDVIGVLFLFIGALMIAGVMMAWGKEGEAAMLRIANRFAGDGKGAELQSLSVATVRSVATGVLGVAVIQSVLMGLGFLMADIPAAGVLAIVVLFIGILQLPALIISIPVVAYIWMSGDASTAMNIFLTIYLIIAGAVDGVLKPMLLGKGLSVPMPVILIGALGGMVAGGMIGLFLGATLLAVAYELFMGWVNDGEILTPGSTGDAEPTTE